MKSYIILPSWLTYCLIYDTSDCKAWTSDADVGASFMGTYEGAWGGGASGGVIEEDGIEDEGMDKDGTKEEEDGSVEDDGIA